VKKPLENTLKLLATTRNDAAVDVLRHAVDADDESLAVGAVRALLSRPRGEAQQVLLAKWPDLSEAARAAIAGRPGRMSAAIRDAILGSNDALRQAACGVALDLREYEHAPALITAAEDPANPQPAVAARAILELAAALSDELSRPRDYTKRRDPKLVRAHVAAALEQSVKRFQRHRRREILEAFLLLAGRDNSVLKRILGDPRDAAYTTFVEIFHKSQQAGVLRLLLAYLDDNRAPMAVLGAVARRSDRPFLDALLRKIGSEPSPAVRANLKRITTLLWIRETPETVLEFDEGQQQAAVEMVMTSGMNRLEIFRIIDMLLRQGNSAGRRAAAAALAKFKGVEANQLALDALDDPDPQVRATVVGQLRERGIPGALARLIGYLDSDEAPVVEAARKCLTEFSVERYLSAFDMLDDDVRRSTGLLVKKVDVQATNIIRDELTAAARSRRLRGLAAAQAMELLDDLENQVIDCLADDDHMVRAAAADALATRRSPAARAALERCLGDSSVAVQNAAQRGLALQQSGAGLDQPAPVESPSLEQLWQVL